MKKHLVMLHGFGCDSRVFASIGTNLSKDLDVLMVDIPGHGQMKEEFRDFPFSAYTILYALDNYLKEPYCLLGWSMGGQIALEMTKQKSVHKCDDPGCSHNPIGSLILISSTPKFVGSDDFPVGMNKAIFNKFKKGLKDSPEKTMGDFYRLMFSDNEDASLYLSGLQTQTPSQNTLSACMESFEKSDERSVLPKIEVPTLIITGDSDRIVDPKASMFLSQEIMNSALKVFKGAGHAPHLTREKEVADEIRKFIR
jgi:pimeloyl-[acyl-carrier protein] methyl ester esterase